MEYKLWLANDGDVFKGQGGSNDSGLRRRSRSRSTSRAEPSMGDGNDDQGDEEPGPVASSTSDAACGTRSMLCVPLRRVSSRRKAGSRRSFHHEVRRLDAWGSRAYRHGTVQEV